MFESLYRVNFNWFRFLILCIIIRLLFPDITWYSFIAIVIFLHQFILLFNSLGFVIPIRYLFGTFMCLQMLIGPLLAYNGLDKFQPVLYQMQIPENEYFSYVIPAVLCFILGLHLSANKLKGELLAINSIKSFTSAYPNVAYYFIFAGFISSFGAEYFPPSFAFVFYLLAGLKFIGVFILILSTQKLKVIPLIIVVGSIISSSLVSAMFHDLLTWFIMLAAVFAIRFKPSVLVKIISCIAFILLSVIIQQVKTSYRDALWNNGQESGISNFTKSYEQNQSENQIYGLTSLATSNVRINQGFIITNIMKKVPNQVPFSNGDELMRILKSAILPRIIATDKLASGDKDIFTKYTGIYLSGNTSMGLSSVGDAYINFGVAGGCIFMFFLGLLYNLVLKGIYNYSKYYPILLLFIPLIFYYPIRPDSELQTNLGHLVKSCFLIFLLFSIWSRQFKITGKSKVQLVSS